ncbi:bifunctional methylenetetrahydrofolate dehydrogenase/cyclohydrolase, mitochondrial [Planococcus citri]|uniref:bifunctional methylenetetrahydrofolate dehydrogenase/cyclohydrolase, mitochondrial n=1 Tax=Planococcus citri TaxID=170843 RepID=UPI0031F9687B
MKFLHFRSVIFNIRRHKATVIDGKSVANKILDNLRNEVETFKYHSKRIPHLKVLLVGDDPASASYVKNKTIAAKVVGIETETVKFAPDIPEETLINTIDHFNRDDNVDAILLQLPLPAKFNKAICQKISPEKDVDGFTFPNFGKFCLQMDSFVPCTALAIQYLLHESGIDITGKNAVICGRSKHVGLPIALILQSDYEPKIGNGANVTICHTHTPKEQTVEFCRNADILISATGVPSLIRGHMIKQGAFVIDVGISRITDPITSKTKLVGDVNFEEAVQVAGYLTPVPGGVGPLTVAMLMKNTITAAKRRFAAK